MPNPLVELVKKADERDSSSNKPKFSDNFRHDVYRTALKNLKAGTPSGTPYSNDDKREVVDAIIESYSFEEGLLANESGITDQMASIATIDQLNTMVNKGKIEARDNFIKQVLNNTNLQEYTGLDFKILKALAIKINMKEASTLAQVTKIIAAINYNTPDPTTEPPLGIINAFTDRIDSSGKDFIAISKKIVEAANKITKPPSEIAIFDKIVGQLSTEEDFDTVFTTSSDKDLLFNQLNNQSLSKLASFITKKDTIDQLLKAVTEDKKITSNFVDNVFNNNKINGKLGELSIDSLLKLSQKTNKPEQLKIIVDSLDNARYFDDHDGKLNSTDANTLIKLAKNATTVEQLKKIASATMADEKVFSEIFNQADNLAKKEALSKRNPLAKFFGYKPEKTQKYLDEKMSGIVGSILSSINGRPNGTKITEKDYVRLVNYATNSGTSITTDNLEIVSPTISKPSVLPNVPAPVVVSPLPLNPSHSTTTASQPAISPPSTGSFTDQATNSLKKNVTEYFQGLDSEGFKALGLEGYKYEDNKILNTGNKTAMETKDDGSVSFPTENGKLDAGQMRLFKEAIKKACKDAKEEDKTVISINGILEKDVDQILTMLKTDQEFMKIRNNVELTSGTQAIKDKIDADLPLLLPTSPTLTAANDSTTSPPTTPRATTPHGPPL